jgi:hypothetical protein
VSQCSLADVVGQLHTVALIVLQSNGYGVTMVLQCSLADVVGQLQTVALIVLQINGYSFTE